MLKKINGLAEVAVLLLATGLAGGCASNPVNSDYDTTADFASYRTFGFTVDDTAGGEQYQSLLDKRLETSITAEMVSRGYTLTEQGTVPDLAIDYHAHIEEKQKVVSSPEPTHWGRSWYDPWPTYHNNVRTVDYKQGTLIINLIDNSSKQMVWQGTMQGTVKRSDMENPREAIASAVSRIFSEYPFRAGMGN